MSVSARHSGLYPDGVRKASVDKPTNINSFGRSAERGEYPRCIGFSVMERRKEPGCRHGSLGLAAWFTPTQLVEVRPTIYRLARKRLFIKTIMKPLAAAAAAHTKHSRSLRWVELGRSPHSQSNIHLRAS